jgi:proteasome lid subunit RPN8/RPN11
MIQVPQQAIFQTLHQLQLAGKRHSECVVLWLGKENGAGIEIREVYRPAQVARADIFRIPSESMRTLLSYLSTQGLMIAAQVHSHPFEAFHSAADDAWAIVRHIDALSLVVPSFALKTTPSTFMRDTKTFRLTIDNQWREVAPTEIGRWLIIH